MGSTNAPIAMTATELSSIIATPTVRSGLPEAAVVAMELPTP
jgi:hypothetical protein